MPGMMHHNCKRGCCLRGSRTEDKRFLASELKAEALSPDAEYEYLRKRSLIADELERIELSPMERPSDG